MINTMGISETCHGDPFVITPVVSTNVMLLILFFFAVDCCMTFLHHFLMDTLILPFISPIWHCYLRVGEERADYFAIRYCVRIHCGWLAISPGIIGRL